MRVDICIATPSFKSILRKSVAVFEDVIVISKLLKRHSKVKRSFTSAATSQRVVHGKLGRDIQRRQSSC